MCTGLFIPVDNENMYQGRTLEFDQILNFQKIISDNIIGIGVNGNVYTDGLNKHGLCVMAFYFLCDASYNPNVVPGKVNLASYELVGYLLNNAVSVDDAIILFNNINITQQPFGAPFNSVLPFHWFMSDKSGRTIIVEAVNGVLNYYDNSTYKVCTNNPTYPEQVSALQTLINNNNFSYCNPPGSNCGLGKGLIGMPGDYSSSSRFQRAYLLSQGMIVPGYNTNILNTIFHFFNNFDIVYGSVQGCDQTPTFYDFTQYTVVYDLSNLTAYYKTYDNQTVTFLGSLNNNTNQRVYPPYLQPMSRLGTQNRTWGAISVGLNGKGSANRIFNFTKRSNQQMNFQFNI